jgi:hypothetical protein
MRSELSPEQRDRLVEMFLSDDRDVRRQACELVAATGEADPVCWYAKQLLDRVWSSLNEWGRLGAVPDRVVLHLQDWDALIRWAQLVSHLGPVIHYRGHGRDVTKLFGVRAIVTRDTERGRPALVSLSPPPPVAVWRAP